MEVIIAPSCDAIARFVADRVERAVRTHDAPVLGLATGSSPLPTYRELIRRHHDEGLSFSKVRAFLLDEYVGPLSDPDQSYRSVIEREFTGHINIAADAVVAPPTEPSLTAAYDAEIEAAGGIDVQILGIGDNGHIGFNEPTASLGSTTRIATLSGTTRRANARFFGGSIDAVPTRVATQGIATILRSREIVLIASGETKAAAIARAVEGPLTSMVPASSLQLHANTTIIVDGAAASALTLAGYYREAYGDRLTMSASGRPGTSG